MAEVDIDHAALQSVVMPRLEAFLSEFVRDGAAQAKISAPSRSGYLKSTIHADGVRRVGPWSLASGVSVDARYAAPVHEGARPHVIRARNSPVLSFYWPKVGRRVFFPRVNHPGNADNPFLATAMNRVASSDPRVTLGDS